MWPPRSPSQIGGLFVREQNLSTTRWALDRIASSGARKPIASVPVRMVKVWIGVILRSRPLPSMFRSCCCCSLIWYLRTSAGRASNHLPHQHIFPPPLVHKHALEPSPCRVQMLPVRLAAVIAIAPASVPPQSHHRWPSFFIFLPGRPHLIPSSRTLSHALARSHHLRSSQPHWAHICSLLDNPWVERFGPASKHDLPSR